MGREARGRGSSCGNGVTGFIIDVTGACGTLPIMPRAMRE